MVIKIKTASGEKYKINDFSEIINPEEVIELNCSGNKLRTLEGINNLTNLQKLNCSENELRTLEGISNLINLQVLYCSDNKLRTLEGINNLINLQKLICFENELRTLEGISNLTTLQTFYCSNNCLDTLEGISNLTNLRNLCCSRNELTTLELISNLINLQYLNCSENKIKTLKGINNLTNLRRLYCYKNQLLTLEGISNLINLQTLYCFGNQIETLELISNLINLRNLSCSDNQITTLDPISNLINLRNLCCNRNKLTTLKGIRELINLQKLNCDENRLTTLPLFLINLRNMIHVNYSNNEIEFIPRPIQRWLDRIQNRYQENINIYDDGQNIHNHHIQDSIRKSINNLFTYETKLDEETLKSEIIKDDILNEKTKRLLLEYIENKDVHSVIGCTFEDLMIQVWSIIREHPESNEIKRILNQEINDSICKCFTGRLSRLVNVLNGYSDLVSITISDNEQKNMIMSIGIRTYDNQEELEEYIRREFEERGFEDVDEWIGYLN